ncbi:Mitochondrial ribonuclease P protein 3 [Lonchura striata]|uniref:Mitochondrial ribonuclease P catalytic subunit n=1 Tax=Lonchura striata TaxID=40157 RepID=A0A218VDW6_9PASE|nr:mitochondrial ribonuclease P catalytic subunit [Lonchura striata domestica]XP_021398367.1 mitochondrial ribonuclease P catalytic subunit [Lonchura striata domestica]OWK64099.1 Mitochondrial ribonuclease P protein 3 [Lonchura striata domestica]
MALFSQISQQGFQALLWKCHIFWPFSRCQQLFAVSLGIPNREKINSFSFMTSSSTALSVDPKETDVLPTEKKSKIDCKEGEGWDEETKEIPEGKFHYSSSVGAAKKWSMSHVLSRHKFSKVQPPEKPLQAEEWNKLREDFQSPEIFEEVMLNSMIRCNSPIDVAKSLLTHLAKRNGDIAYSVLVKYLTLCVQQGQVSEIRDVHDIMKARFKILESGAYSLLIRGLSNSNQWRMALTVLEEVKKIMIPSRMCYESCIKAASHHQEMKLAFELYNEMLAKGLVPTLDVLQSFFDFSRGMKGAELQKELFGILLYLRENQIYPHKTFMRSIKLWFESLPGGNWRGHLTNVKDSGQCPVCKHQLEESNLTEQEYSHLSERIIRDVIHGTDTFRKTSPKELEAFQTFVENRLPFDIVIDGLNVSHIKSRRMQCENLLDAVNCLAKENARLLVLGRKHMLMNSSNWKREIMKEMQNKADFFFAENISEDDAFLLYATLRSGKHCRFVTRDFLRDHKACLSDSLTRHLFRKWQRGHQIVFFPSADGRSIKFLPALSYDCVVQTTGDTWHIPYKDVFEEKYSYEVPRKWLCIQQKL